MNQPSVVIIEDNNEYRTFLKSILDRKYRVADFDSTEAARPHILANAPDSILLDIGLKDEDGFSFCADLKKDKNTHQIPVLFLTSKEAVADKVAGFSLGADDYMIKPIDPLELIARLEVAFRRSKPPQSESTAPLNEKHGIKIDLSNFRASLFAEGEKEIELRLTPTEFKILNFFIQNDQKLLSREKILAAVWGQDTHVVDRAIDTHVHTLRKKLGIKSELIQSVFGEGYRFGPEK